MQLGYRILGNADPGDPLPISYSPEYHDWPYGREIFSAILKLLAYSVDPEICRNESDRIEPSKELPYQDMPS